MDKYGGVGGVGGLVLLLLAAILHAAHTEFAFSFQVRNGKSFTLNYFALKTFLASKSGLIKR